MVSIKYSRLYPIFIDRLRIRLFLKGSDPVELHLICSPVEYSDKVVSTHEFIFMLAYPKWCSWNFNNNKGNLNKLLLIFISDFIRRLFGGDKIGRLSKMMITQSKKIMLLILSMHKVTSFYYFYGRGGNRFIMYVVRHLKKNKLFGFLHEFFSLKKS